MMKMKVSECVLILSCVLSVSADVLHEDIRIVGCSKTDGEQMYALDSEEMWYADFVNKKGVMTLPSFVDSFGYEEGTYEGAVANQQICKDNLAKRRSAMKDIPLKLDAPTAMLIYSKEDVEFEEKNTLICHVTGFYPAPVKIHWTKNQEKVTEETSINVPYVNKDGSFVQISRLDFTPQQGDIYSCTVEHPALEKPLTRFWDAKVEGPQPGVGPAVFCGLGLTIGLLGVAAGTFFLIKGNECS